MTVLEIYKNHRSPISKSKKISESELFAAPVKVKADYRIKDKKNCKLLRLQETLTEKEYGELKPVLFSLYKKVGKNKYGNVGITINGIYFQSTKEGRYYEVLEIKKKAGLLVGFKRQIPFTFIVNGVRIGKYEADFGVLNLDGTIDIIDVKGAVTFALPEFQMKMALMEACFGVKLKIIGLK